MITSPAGWDKWTHETVEPFLAEFGKLREAMVEAGQYPYNDSFLGKIPGIAGEGEGTAIYRLQGLYEIREQERKIDALRADGFVQVNELPAKIRCKRIVVYRPGHFSGGTGLISEYQDARLVPKDGKPWMILPKGKSRNGFQASSGIVLVKA